MLDYDFIFHGLFGIFVKKNKQKKPPLQRWRPWQGQSSEALGSAPARMTGYVGALKCEITGKTQQKVTSLISMPHSFSAEFQSVKPVVGLLLLCGHLLCFNAAELTV